jgi:predicted aspartyl protease
MNKITSQSIKDGNYLSIRINRCLVRSLIDTGASISLVASFLIKRLNLTVEPSNVDSDTDFIMTITGDEPLVDAGNCTDTDEQLCFDSSGC